MTGSETGLGGCRLGGGRPATPVLHLLAPLEEGRRGELGGNAAGAVQERRLLRDVRGGGLVEERDGGDPRGSRKAFGKRISTPPHSMKIHRNSGGALMAWIHSGQYPLACRKKSPYFILYISAETGRRKRCFLIPSHTQWSKNVVFYLLILNPTSFYTPSPSGLKVGP